MDNCSTQLHKQLAEALRSSPSSVSLLTVEYDIREDQPEGTDVIRLDTASRGLIEKLIARRYPHLSQVDCSTIAKFSGGNAPVAISMGETVRGGESIRGLTDEELFQRLFLQRHPDDPDLNRAAQILSLVYSFNGENIDGVDAELPVLGNISKLTADDLYSAAAELRQRNLIQSRGEWRAVLPHTVANRLAALAMKAIPRHKLESAFINSGAERLLRSFTRRLGYLDTSTEAIAIVNGMLGQGGLLGDLTTFNEARMVMFENIAPVCPAGAIDVIERALIQPFEKTEPHLRAVVRLLRSLAYDSTSFERAVSCLEFRVRPKDEASVDEDPTNVLISLFHIYLSGTHATSQQRIAIVRRWSSSEDARMQQLAVKALEALLETNHFSSSYGFEFGARSRDHGYHPKTHIEINEWYKLSLEHAESVATSNVAISPTVRAIIGRSLRGLWSGSRSHDQIEHISHNFAKLGFWREGWIGAGDALRYDSEGMTEPFQARRQRAKAMAFFSTISRKV